MLSNHVLILYFTVCPSFLSDHKFSITCFILNLFLFVALYLFYRHSALNSWLYYKKKQNSEHLELIKRTNQTLKTPLSVILNSLEELDIQSQGQCISQKLQLIQNQANLLLEQVNLLADFNKSVPRSSKTIPQIVDLNKTIKNYINYSEGIAALKKIQITLEDKTSDAHFTTYTKQLNFIIGKIIYHTIVVSDIDNTIEIRLDYPDNNRLFSSASYSNTPKQSFLISVKFRNSTQPPPFIYKLFNLFSSSRHNISFGLEPLTTSIQNVLTQSNGEIYFKSYKKREVEAFVLLKSNTGDNARPPLYIVPGKKLLKKQDLTITHNHSIPPKQSKNILIVEDNKTMLSLFVELIGTLGNVETATNGEEGLEKALLLFPDLIITDFIMPVLNGQDFITKIKKDIRTCHIPIIAISALDEISAKTRLIKSGADYYITKPFNNELLLSTIETIFKNRMFFENKICSRNTASSPNSGINEKDSYFIHSLRCYIMANISDPNLKYDKLSNEFNVSKSLLFQRVKLLTKKTPGELIKDIRLENALNLILSKGKNISEATYASGFNSVSSFSNSFKKEYGLTPSQYIEANSFKKPAR